MCSALVSLKCIGSFNPGNIPYLPLFASFDESKIGSMKYEAQRMNRKTVYQHPCFIRKNTRSGLDPGSWLFLRNLHGVS